MLARLVRPSGSNVIVGSDESYAPYLGTQLVIEALETGHHVVEMIDDHNDSLRGPLANYSRDTGKALPLDHLHTYSDVRFLYRPREVSTAILLYHDLPTDKPTLIYRLRGAATHAHVARHWLPLAQETAQLLPLMPFFTVLTWGSALQPKPPLKQYAADHLHYLRVAHSIQLTLVNRDTGDEIKLKGELDYSLITFKQVETHDV
jgi:hypothetical protein